MAWASLDPAPLDVLAAHSTTEPPRPHSQMGRICSVGWTSHSRSRDQNTVPWFVKTGHVTWILACDWSRPAPGSPGPGPGQPQSWPLIGRPRSRDQNTVPWFGKTGHVTWILAYDLLILITWPKNWPVIIGHTGRVAWILASTWSVLVTWHVNLLLIC